MKVLLFLLLLPLPFIAQKIPLSSFKKYPFPSELCSASQGAKIAWALDEKGNRNVYVAEGPDYKPRKLTNFNKDDGQEITSLSISDNGQWVVFVRGGDHGANWDDGLPLNPTGETKPFTVKIASIPFNGGEVKYLSEGDEPLITPDGKAVTFIKGGQVWSSAIDSTSGAKKLFTTRGTVSSLEWNSGGSALMFVTDRGDHSIIGIYTNENTPIQWITPSFVYDDAPHWSPDGKRIVFIRMPGRGGDPDSMLVRKHRPWAIYTADLATNKASLLWKAPMTLRGSIPSTHGGFNLHWAYGDRIVFLSYQDGWPHLYSIPSSGGKETLLTPGNFMCEHISISSDGRYLTFSANTGPDKLDLERRHAAKVSVDKADMQVLTPGNGNEWTPVLTDRNQVVAFISATPQQSPLPAIMKLNGDNKMQLVGTELVPGDFPKDKLVTPKQVIFTAADGVTVHADLFLPEGGMAKKPAIVYIHGGPPRQMLLGWHYSDYYSNAYASNLYLASLGYVVLAVNYRLGIGYGYEFHQPAHGGIAGGAEYKDIKAGGEWLARQTFVDATKIGVYGGSYGGYLTAMALAKDSKLFAAGVDIHGVHDWGIAANIMSAFNGQTQKAPDYEKAIQTAWSSSPVSMMQTWKSPVLIIHADDDRNVRFNQSTDLIRRLEKRGIPYESMIIVDDTHHWMNWENSVKVYDAVADFFNRKFMK
ncbi:MAG: prolyl oligopeptidase family serine peptidase [Saprospiraceae bacterium]